MRIRVLIHFLLGLDVLLAVQIQHVLIFLFQLFLILFQYLDFLCLLGITPLQELHILILQPQGPLVAPRFLFRQLQLPCFKASKWRFCFSSKSANKSSPLLFQDPPLDVGTSSSAKSVVAFLFFPDFVPPLAAALAALFALSRPLRLSALARLAGDSAFLCAGMGLSK